MDPTSYEREMAANWKAYEALRDQLRREHAGQYAAIAEGKLIAVTPSYDAALASLQALEPTPEHFLVFGVDDETVLDPFYSY